MHKIFLLIVVLFAFTMPLAGLENIPNETVFEFANRAGTMKLFITGNITAINKEKYDRKFNEKTKLMDFFEENRIYVLKINQSQTQIYPIELDPTTLRALEIGSWVTFGMILRSSHRFNLPKSRRGSMFGFYRK